MSVCKDCAFWEYNDDEGLHRCKSCFSFSGTFLGFSHIDQCVTTWILLGAVILLCCFVPICGRCCVLRRRRARAAKYTIQVASPTASEAATPKTVEMNKGEKGWSKGYDMSNPLTDGSPAGGDSKVVRA